jgi:aminoglycoside phosphotransferase (APT) family kinase protein
VYRTLQARVPKQGPATIVHGDYRLDNTMVDGDGRVIAVLDWEICTLGDPLADVGLLMVYWAEADDSVEALPLSPTVLPGFPNRKEVAARYAERSGRDLADLDFYVAFGYWKLACILEGVFARYSHGAMGNDGAAFEGFGKQVITLGEMAQATAAHL